MKKILLGLLYISSLFVAGGLQAQTFTVQHDTVTLNGNVPVTGNDPVRALSGSVTVKWKVFDCNFPADWLTGGYNGICDNNLCHNFPGITGLWPAGTLETSNPYDTALGGFDAQLDLTSSTSYGCYYLRVRLYDAAIPTNADTITFIVCRSTTGTPVVVKSTDNVVLFPNPAREELNLTYEASADIKNIAVYNIIGKSMGSYKVSGSSAKLDIETLPQGIYFVRLINSSGEVVVSRKFTKQ